MEPAGNQVRAAVKVYLSDKSYDLIFYIYTFIYAITERLLVGTNVSGTQGLSRES